MSSKLKSSHLSSKLKHIHTICKHVHLQDESKKGKGVPAAMPIAALTDYTLRRRPQGGQVCCGVTLLSAECLLLRARRFPCGTRTPFSPRAFVPPLPSVRAHRREPQRPQKEIRVGRTQFPAAPRLWDGPRRLTPPPTYRLNHLRYKNGPIKLGLTHLPNYAPSHRIRPIIMC